MLKKIRELLDWYLLVEAELLYWSSSCLVGRQGRHSLCSGVLCTVGRRPFQVHRAGWGGKTSVIVFFVLGGQALQAGEAQPPFQSFFVQGGEASEAEPPCQSSFCWVGRHGRQSLCAGLLYAGRVTGEAKPPL